MIRRRRPRRETPGGRGRRASTRAATSRFGGSPVVDAEVAYRLRTEGPPDEWHGDLTVGFKFAPKIMLMLQSYTTVSMSTSDPTFPAWRSSVAEASVVYALNDKWSIQLGVFSTVWTVKTNSQHGAAVAVWWNF